MYSLMLSTVLGQSIVDCASAWFFMIAINICVKVLSREYHNEKSSSIFANFTSVSVRNFDVKDVGHPS